IIEYVLFARQVACQMPCFAVFSTAAKIRNGVNPALLQPDATIDTEARRQTDAEAAVAGQQRRIATVQLRSLAANNVQRHFGAVLRGGEFADHFAVAEVGRGCPEQSRLSCLPRSGIKTMPGRRIQVS